jgi:hypothetical protein
VCGSLVTIKQNRKDNRPAGPAPEYSEPAAKPGVMRVSPDGTVHLPGAQPEQDWAQAGVAQKPAMKLDRMQPLFRSALIGAHKPPRVSQARGATDGDTYPHSPPSHQHGFQAQVT